MKVVPAADGSMEVWTSGNEVVRRRRQNGAPCPLPHAVQPLTDSTAAAASQTAIQPRRQRWALPAGLTEGDLQLGYAQAVRP